MASDANTAGGMLRLTLSKAVDPEALATLHSAGMAGPLPGALAALFAQAGVAEISGVHTLSPAELADDRYGFAREFSVVLKPGISPDAAAELLRRSPLVESVKPVLLRQAY